MSHTPNTKKIYDYTKRKDCFMGRENRRYWLVNIKTGKKKRITEEQYHGPGTPGPKPQAPSSSRYKPQAASLKLQAASLKRLNH